MAIVEDSIAINAPAAGLFALSQDYALRRAWDPFVREMRIGGNATEAGKGVRVWVRAWTGLTIEVVFTGFQPPRSVAMKMVRGPWFLRRFAGTWLFEQRPDGQTVVTFRYSFAASKWLSALADRIIVWIFRRDVRSRLQGLKRGAEIEGLLERIGQPCH